MEPLLFNLSYPVISWNIHKTPMKLGFKYIGKYLIHPWNRNNPSGFFYSNIKIFKISWDTLEILLKQTMGKYLIFIDKNWQYSTIDYLYWLVIIPNIENFLTFLTICDDLKQYWTIFDKIVKYLAISGNIWQYWTQLENICQYLSISSDISP